MQSNDNSISDSFLEILKFNQSQNYNPFDKINKTQSNNFPKFFNFFGSYEDSLEIEVRCPICLGRVHNAVNSPSCRHIFCSLCLKKSMKYSKKCPVCRVKIYSVMKIDIKTFPLLDTQMDIFAKY